MTMHHAQYSVGVIYIYSYTFVDGWEYAERIGLLMLLFVMNLEVEYSHA
jgi:hypothetical protein